MDKQTATKLYQQIHDNINEDYLRNENLQRKCLQLKLHKIVFKLNINYQKCS